MLLSEQKYLADALKYAFKEKKAAHNTLLDVKSMLKYINISIKALEYDFLDLMQINKWAYMRISGRILE